MNTLRTRSQFAKIFCQIWWNKFVAHPIVTVFGAILSPVLGVLAWAWSPWLLLLITVLAIFVSAFEGFYALWKKDGKEINNFASDIITKTKLSLAFERNPPYVENTTLPNSYVQVNVVRVAVKNESPLMAQNVSVRLKSLFMIENGKLLHANVNLKRHGNGSYDSNGPHEQFHAINPNSQEFFEIAWKKVRPQAPSDIHLCEARAFTNEEPRRLLSGASYKLDVEVVDSMGVHTEQAFRLKADRQGAIVFGLCPEEIVQSEAAT